MTNALLCPKIVLVICSLLFPCVDCKVTFRISHQIAGKINTLIRESGLKELGQLEQDLVFGDAGTKDVINFLRTKQVFSV
jgi:hypothetical protein